MNLNGNPEIIYNGVSSETMGVIVTRLPDFHRPARRVTQTTIPGRSLPVVADEGGYDPYQTTLEINANGVPLRDIYTWLRGEGWMISSDEPDYKAYVYLNGEIEDERFRVGGECHDTLRAPLLVEPFRREVNETAEVSDEAWIFDGKGTDPAWPLIAVTGEGDIDLMVNGSSVLIDDLNGTIYIDSEAGVAYTIENGEKQWAGTQITLMDGWPVLQIDPHGNEVNWSGNVTQVTIQPNWRYL